MQSEFSYATQPHAAPVKRSSKYRDQNDQAQPNIQNIMYDNRVIRGSTYATRIGTGVKDAATSKTLPVPPSKKRYAGRKPSTPPPVDGRVHMDIQTEEFLEELTDRPVELDVETQTQPFMDRPASPLFVRGKTGLDVETQIENGDLFDFDMEVEPILEILVGKTLHVSMLELMQEEELEAIRLQEEEFEMVRNLELAEVKRLEAEAQRRAEEKNRRVDQEKKRLADRRALERKIAARSFAHQFLGSLHESVFDSLEEEGFFTDPVKQEVEDIFMLELRAQAQARVSSFSAAIVVAEELLDAARVRARRFAVEANEIKRRLAAEAEAAKLEEEKRMRAAAKAEAEAAAALEAALEAGEVAAPGEDDD